MCKIHTYPKLPVSFLHPLNILAKGRLSSKVPNVDQSQEPFVELKSQHMLVRRKRSRKKPLPNRWPDFVRYVAWPIGEENEVFLWATLMDSMHLLLALMALLIGLKQLQQDCLNMFELVIACAMVIPWISFTIIEYIV